MPLPLLVRLLGAAGIALRALKNPLRREAIQAAKKAGTAFSKSKVKSTQLCSRAWRAIRGRNIKFAEGAIQKKFKHAGDFGVKGDYSPANAVKFQQAIEAHVADPATKVIRGTYHGDPVIHYVGQRSGINVIKDASGHFVSGWKLSPAQMKHVLFNGKL